MGDVGSVTIAANVLLQVTLLLFAAVSRMRIRHLRRLLAQARGGTRDDETGLLRPNSIPYRLEPEMQWAQLEGNPYSILVVDPGEFVTPAAAALIARKRDHESAFLLEDGLILLGLWDTDAAGARLAAQRLGAAVGAVVPEALVGAASYPDDDDSVFGLEAAAWARLAPLAEEHPPNRTIRIAD